MTPLTSKIRVTSPSESLPTASCAGSDTLAHVTSRRLHLVLAAVAVPVLALSLTGCFNGQNATTNYQATMNSGQGSSGQIGDIKINNATLVLGPEGSKSVTLIMSISDQGTTGDSLIAVNIGDQAATFTSGTTTPATEIAIAAQQTLPIGYSTADTWVNSYAFEQPVSTWVPVRFAFKNAGMVEVKVLVVEASGIYTGIAPNPATLPQGATAS